MPYSRHHAGYAHLGSGIKSDESLQPKLLDGNQSGAEINLMPKLRRSPDATCR